MSPTCLYGWGLNDQMHTSLEAASMNIQRTHPSRWGGSISGSTIDWSLALSDKCIPAGFIPHKTRVCTHVCAHVCLRISMLKTTYLVSRWAPFHFTFEEQPSTRQKERSIQCQKRVQLQEVKELRWVAGFCTWEFRRLSEHLLRKYFFKLFLPTFL